MTPSQECPVCEGLAQILECGLEEITTKLTESGSSFATHTVCSNCGTLYASTLLLEMIQGEQHRQTRGTLSKAIRAKNDAGTKVLLVTREDILKCIRDFEISNQ